jgi:hypothetical protein
MFALSISKASKHKIQVTFLDSMNRQYKVNGGLDNGGDIIPLILYLVQLFCFNFQLRMARPRHHGVSKTEDPRFKV